MEVDIMRSLILFILLSFPAYSASAQTNSKLINEQLSIYSEAYPEIDFVLLYKMEDFDQLTPLTGSLGEDLSNVDYEHPEDLRITLVEAQEYRIALQLENGNGSATLFKTPNSLITNKPYTCLITMGLPLHEGDLAATRFIYDISDEALKSLPESYHLDNQDFLAYSVDHEIFHCIDSYTNGFMYPKTRDPVKSLLDRSHAERRAEIFAAMAHLSRQPNGKKFLLNLANARTLSLLNADVEHYTSDALIMMVESSKPNNTLGIIELARKSMRIADDNELSFTEHKDFIVTLRTVLEGFEIDTDFWLTEYPELALEVPSPDKVELLRSKITNAQTVINSNHIVQLLSVR